MIDLSQLPTPEPIMETIADVEAFEKTPLTEQFPYTDSYNLIKDSADRFTDKAALEFLLQGLPDEPAQIVSFAELGAQVTRTANLLNQLGVNTDDAVSIILPILPQTHFAIWGAQAAGISNPINPMLEAEHIAEIIAAANAKIVICLAQSEHSDINEKVRAAVSNCAGVTTLLEVNIPELCKPVSATLTKGNFDTLDFDSSIATMDGTLLTSDRKFSGDQKAAYFHTGGTTDRPSWPN